MGNDLRIGSLTLRNAQPSDCEDILRWRNDSVTRLNSFHSRPISEEEHRAWYQKALRDENCVLVLALEENGERAGIARFDLNGTKAEININVAPEKRGHGFGKLLVRAAIDYLYRARGKFHISARIKQHNVASIKTFERCGFSKREARGDYVVFGYER